jgi:hypothetical protein
MRGRILSAPMFEPRALSLASIILRVAGIVVVPILYAFPAQAGADVPLSHKALTSSDVPSKYSKVVKNISSDLAPCAELYMPEQLTPRFLIAFDANDSAFEEGLVEVRQISFARSLFADLDHRYSACRRVQPISSLKVSGTGRRISFPMLGEQSQAFSFTLTFKRAPIDSEMVLFRQGAICGEVEYIGGVAVSRSEMVAIASRAVEKTLASVAA